MTTADTVRKIIAKHLNVDLPKVTDAAKLGDHLGADSLDGVEITMVMEEEFNIEISDDQGRSVRTVGDLIALVKNLKGEA